MKQFTNAPADPRTVIYRTLAQEVSENRKSLDLSIEIADYLAHWITMEANNFPPFDERTPGYHDLAQRLTGR